VFGARGTKPVLTPLSRGAVRRRVPWQRPISSCARRDSSPSRGPRSRPPSPRSLVRGRRMLRNEAAASASAPEAVKITGGPPHRQKRSARAADWGRAAAWGSLYVLDAFRNSWYVDPFFEPLSRGAEREGATLTRAISCRTGRDGPGAGSWLDYAGEMVPLP